MRKIMRIAAVALALMLTLNALAAVVDLNRKGTIVVRVHTVDEIIVDRAVLKLYRVADAKIKNNNLTYELTGAFASSGVSLDDLDDSKVANKLASMIKKSTPVVQAQITDDDGYAYFNDVEVGLYLVVQDGFDGPKKYFSPVESFLVSMPHSGGANWTYYVVAQPKVRVLPTPKPTPKPPDSPSDDTLPQPGLVMWPVMALGGGGVLMFALGWALVFLKKKEQTENEAA